jgi:hypothetical protein
MADLVTPLWLVAGLIKLRVLPRNEAGMRILDAVFGTVAFAYLFLFGVRLAGPADPSRSIRVGLEFDDGYVLNVPSRHAPWLAAAVAAGGRQFTARPLRP